MMLDGSVGKVRIRSNVVLEKDSWDLVPGEIVKGYRRDHFTKPDKPPRKQRDEKMYYEPCSVCHRTIDRINLEGCEQCTDAPPPERLQANRERHQAVLLRVAEERSRRGEG